MIGPKSMQEAPADIPATTSVKPSDETTTNINLFMIHECQREVALVAVSGDLRSEAPRANYYYHYYLGYAIRRAPILV